MQNFCLKISITGNRQKVDCPIIFKHTIHYDILFIDCYCYKMLQMLHKIIKIIS